ncbi:MAG: NifB/NifX family molybdenum-iron cluster-binding protein [Candidatus Hydrogenedentes bacterium]|nr:NifB/NifX family molybdenum-iron cluster-binding protein [Candidatus Hydrogenedentota bacterium]
MKIAIPQWEHRVSPMLDVAGNVMIAEVNDGRVANRNEFRLDQADAQNLAHVLHQLGVKVVICGAVSRQLELTLLSEGFELSAHICGPVEEVLAAYLEGRLEGNEYRMPGCCGRRRHSRNRLHCHRRNDGGTR